MNSSFQKLLDGRYLRRTSLLFSLTQKCQVTFLRASKGLFSPEAYHQMSMLQIKEQIHILNANNNFQTEIDLAVNFRGRDCVTLRPLENISRIKRFIYSFEVFTDFRSKQKRALSPKSGKKLGIRSGNNIELQKILTLYSCKNQAKEQQASAIAVVIFQVLISLIKLNLNALIGQQGEKREI